MSGLSQHGQAEVERLLACEVGLRQELRTLEAVDPRLARLTSGIRVQLCELLAALNGVRSVLGAQRMTEPLTADHVDALQGELQRMRQSLHRAGDYSLDEEEEGGSWNLKGYELHH